MRQPLINVRSWDSLAWGVVVAIWAAVCIYYAVEEWRNGRRFRNSLTAIGVVTSPEQGWQSRDDGEPSRIVYRFKSRTGEEFSGASSEFIPEGESTKVEYLPSDPTSNRVKGTNPSREKIVQYLFFAGLLLTVGGWLLLHGYNEKTAQYVSGGNAVAPSNMPFVRFPLIILSVASACILYNAAFETHSQAFYQILRWLVCATAILYAVNAYRWGNNLAPWIFVVLAILFNPIAPIHLARESWSVIDRIVAIILLVAIFIVKPKRYPSVHNPTA